MQDRNFIAQVSIHHIYLYTHDFETFFTIEKEKQDRIKSSDTL